MKVVAQPAVVAFLGAPTPRSWIDFAVTRLDALLNDHANCEKKAAASALALLFRYPGNTALAEKMSRLAREELRHYEQVLALMKKLEIAMRTVRPSGYAAQLRQACRNNEPGRLLDTLIIGALIEARSCERFAALVPELPKPVAKFYGRLLESEARHFEDYLAFARALNCDDFEQRLSYLRDLETQLIIEPARHFAFHSGPPISPDGAELATRGRARPS